MRRVFGELMLPANAPEAVARKIVIELRDVSVLDAPSQVLATATQSKVAIQPGRRVPFELHAPDAAPGRTLNLRVHVSMAGGTAAAGASAGDLLTTESIAVPASGECGPLSVRLTRI